MGGGVVGRKTSCEGLANTKIKHLKNGPNPASFGLFLIFSHDKYSTNTINDLSVDGVLWTQTQGGRMVGTDKSTELWRHPKITHFLKTFISGRA